MSTMIYNLRAVLEAAKERQREASQAVSHYQRVTELSLAAQAVWDADPDGDCGVTYRSLREDILAVIDAPPQDEIRAAVKRGEIVARGGRFYLSGRSHRHVVH